MRVSVFALQANRLKNKSDDTAQEFTSKAMVFGSKETGVTAGLHFSPASTCAKLWIDTNDSFVSCNSYENARFIGWGFSWEAMAMNPNDSKPKAKASLW